MKVNTYDESLYVSYQDASLFAYCLVAHFPSHTFVIFDSRLPYGWLYGNYI